MKSLNRKFFLILYKPFYFKPYYISCWWHWLIGSVWPTLTTIINTPLSSSGILKDVPLRIQPQPRILLSDSRCSWIQSNGRMGRLLLGVWQRGIPHLRHFHCVLIPMRSCNDDTWNKFAACICPQSLHSWVDKWSSHLDQWILRWAWLQPEQWL